MLEIPLNIEMVKAKLSDSDTVVNILGDAASWLSSRGIPAWNIEQLPTIMYPSIEQGLVYLAKLNGQFVGTITLQWTDVPFWGERPADAGYIHKLAVMRKAAGKNVGAQMVLWAESQIVAAKRPYSRLDCLKDNPTINKFYQNLGYIWCGEKLVNDFPANLYQKTLTF